MLLDGVRTDSSELGRQVAGRSDLQHRLACFLCWHPAWGVPALISSPGWQRSGNSLHRINNYVYYAPRCRVFTERERRGPGSFGLLQRVRSSFCVLFDLSVYDGGSDAGMCRQVRRPGVSVCRRLDNTVPYERYICTYCRGFPERVSTSLRSNDFYAFLYLYIDNSSIPTSSRYTAVGCYLWSVL